MEKHSGVTSQQAMGAGMAERRVASVIKRDGKVESFYEQKIFRILQRCAEGINDLVDCQLVFRELHRTIFDGITTVEIEKGVVLAAATFIEQEPAYGKLASRLLRQRLMREVLGKAWTDTHEYEQYYRQAFIDGIHNGIALECFDKRLGEFNLPLLAAHIDVERDDLLDYMGTHTLYERYLLKENYRRYELIQSFWMRIAMGLALNEPDKDTRALEFYEAISTLRYMPSTPTLFHSGFVRAQLSSCYLNTTSDDLGHIFKVLGDNAQLSKWAGGLGTDWTAIRGAGSYIKSIKATSQGVIPYLKIANDVVLAITRSGIRRGGSCAYLEVWHLDIEDFFDLRRNTGDERRRTHDMNTAAWIPDLFMKRVEEDGLWTLFSPHETPDLHDLYGKAFEARYQEYENLVGTEKITLYKTVSAKQLWRKLLTRLFETGHPWITFKDACNIRSPQDHVGIVHCSNLCTEITLNTSEDETAVCNLGSINLEKHFADGVLDTAQLQRTIRSAVRMLDNVIDLNFYPIIEAKNSNMRHRPVGLGLMGFQDALFKLDIPFSSPQALDYADRTMEMISYYAIEASALLASERGSYRSDKGSKWDRGIFPLDTIALLEQERGCEIPLPRTTTMDWDTLRELVKKHGMRNSNVMAIAPTASISTIVGCYPCIEPIFKNMYVKSNVSGEFTIINSYLVEDLKKLSLWDKIMLDQIKYHDGDLDKIANIPDKLKEKYRTAFELDPEWLIKISAARGKWLDQSQSYNVFLKGVSGKQMHDIYMTAWRYGLKTTYYARTLGATQVEKSTLDAKTFGFTQKREHQGVTEEQKRIACSIENPESCESCQ